MTQAFDISTSKRSAAAVERLESRFRIGQRAQDALVQQVANLHIKDKLVPPDKMFFSCDGKRARVHYGDISDKGALIHPHALNQMSKVSGLPKIFMTRLVSGEPWEQMLFEHNMDMLFHNGKFKSRSTQPIRFLHRLVGPDDNLELRGFLTRSFNRRLASIPLLAGFMDACQKVGALPIEASTSAVNFSLKCFLPHVFEPVDGEFIAIGVMWSNSDFGAGRLLITLSIMRISGGTLAAVDDVHHRTHLGSIIEDIDLEISDETATKEVEAQISAIRDAVVARLTPDSISRLLKAISIAHEEQIPWNKLREELGQILSTKEVEDVKKLLESNSSDIIDLPPPGRTASGEPISTRWWGSQILGWLASKEADPDRKSDLQFAAGQVLNIK